jgi:hypothetical protein
MSLIRRKKANEADASEQARLADELHQRALRLVDTRGVVVRAAEAELQAALAAQRVQSTPERDERVAQATRALDAARAALR